jgi:hypothetical protein
MIAGIGLAVAAVILGGCAAGNLGGTSLLPSANQNRQLNLAHHLNIRTGQPGAIRHLDAHGGDVLGGPTPGEPFHIRSNDVLGGPTVTPPSPPQ